MKILPDQIGFDLDGVVADTAEAFIRMACEEYNLCSFTLEDITDFQVEECLDISSELVEKIFNDILKNSLAAGLKPMPGSVEVISSLTNVAKVTIITARPLASPVIDWLESLFPAKTCANINLVAMGDHNDKVRYIKEHGLSYFVDDRLETCRQIAETSIEITPLVFNQPWNKKHHNFYSVSNWQGIKELVHLEMP